MPFQSTVAAQQGFGLPGERAFDAPFTAQPALLNSTSAANNVVGRAARYVSGATGSWSQTGASDPKPVIASVDAATGAFAGIIACPKEQVGSSLTPGSALPNGTVVDLIQGGDVVVQFAAACAVGDTVYVSTLTPGTFITTAPGAGVPANTYGPIGTVARFTATAANLGVVHLTGV